MFFLVVLVDLFDSLIASEFSGVYERKEKEGNRKRGICFNSWNKCVLNEYKRPRTLQAAIICKQIRLYGEISNQIHRQPRGFIKQEAGFAYLLSK